MDSNFTRRWILRATCNKTSKCFLWVSDERPAYAFRKTRTALQQGQHPNQFLQAAAQIHGHESIVFHELDAIEVPIVDYDVKTAKERAELIVGERFKELVKVGRVDKWQHGYNIDPNDPEIPEDPIIKAAKLQNRVDELEAKLAAISEAEAKVIVSIEDGGAEVEWESFADAAEHFDAKPKIAEMHIKRAAKSGGKFKGLRWELR